MSCGTLVPASAFFFSLTRLLRPLAGLSRPIQLRISSVYAGPQPQKACSLVWALSSSLAATTEIDFSFSSSGYLDVSVPRVPSFKLCIYLKVSALPADGFPHSDVMGSMPACGSPMLFAACHVLLRCLVPWHPPCALLRLITSILRLVTTSSGLLTFIFRNWSLRLSRISLCAVVKVRGEVFFTFQDFFSES